MTASHSSLIVRHTSRLELALVVLLFLLAFFFRTYELTGLGLGIEHDEVAEWQIANNIRHGENALFFKEAYGQEPLFLYLMAGSITLFGDNVFAVRFTAVFVAMLTLAASYRLLRRMFSPIVALVALTGLSIALWPIFWGRVGLRAMTLPLMLALGFDWLWRGLTTDYRPPTTNHQPSAMPMSLRFSAEWAAWRSIQQLRPFVFSGVFFGLSAYTYLSSRALPILLAIFTLYLVLFARKKMTGKWRGLFLCYVVAALITLPLVITLQARPDLQFRVSEVSAPLDKALQGDWSEVNANVSRALGMFTMQGDTTVRDNWPNRPVFPEAIGQWLFLGGVIVAFTRFRQPRYVLALSWMAVMLIPTIFSTGAPNFTRTLGALPMVFAMPGIAVEALLFWAPRLFPLQMYDTVSRITNVLIVVGLIMVLGVNIASTYEDYFIKWPQHPETQFVFQADFAAIAKDIDANQVPRAYVGGLSNDSMDAPSLYLLRQRKDVKVGWFDSGSPISSGGALMDFFTISPPTYIPSIVPVSSLLEDRLSNARCINVLVTDRFRRYQWRCGGTPGIPPEARQFEDTALFVWASNDITRTLQAGDTMQFVTTWRAADPLAYPRRIFVHLVNPQTGQIIAQHDGLDSPTKYWQPNDYISQVHKLLIPVNTPPGKYELRIGMYDPTNGKRVLQTDLFGTEPQSDHFVLGIIEVTR